VYENTIYDPATARCTVASATVAGCGAAGGTVVTDPFPNNVIPTSRLDPVAAKIQAYIPLPQVGGLLNNYSPEVISPITNDLPGFKVDQVITQNFKTSFYFSRLKDISINSNDGLPLPISAQRPTTSTVDTYRLNNDYTVTPNILVHFGVGYIRPELRCERPAWITQRGGSRLPANRRLELILRWHRQRQWKRAWAYPAKYL
jgi:hypothetical protein